MEVTQAQQKKLLMGLLLGVGLIAWTNFFFLPQRQIWVKRRPEVQKLREEIIRTERDLTHLKTLEENRSRLAVQVEMKYLETPPQEQLPELLERIAQTARVSKVALSSLKPSADLNALSPGLSGYLELPLSIQFSAGYHQIGKFLDALESSEDLLRVQKLEIRSASGDVLKHKANLTLQAYLVPAISLGDE